MIRNKYLSVVIPLYFFILGAWFVSTIFIDFFAVMAVFKNVSSIFEAGTVGMYIFNSFNKFELVFGLLLLISSFFYCHPNKKLVIVARITASFLLILAAYYLFFLSPMISELTIQMHKVGVGNLGYETLEQTHQVYHKQYVKLDSLKILLLLFHIIVGVITNLKLNNSSKEVSP